MSTLTLRLPREHADTLPPDPVGQAERRERCTIDRRTADLVAALAGVTAPEEEAILRRRLVLANLPLATRVARRYTGRGEALDDLIQTARLGLVKAAHAFDPHVGRNFARFAMPTISGELKRHFRDHGWDIRPPRRLQELRVRIAQARSELEQALGRSPTTAEVSRHLLVTEEEVIESLATAGLYNVTSLEATLAARNGAEGGTGVPALVDRYHLVDESVSVRPLISQLPDRDRQILYLRYVTEWTQSRIGQELGISQVQVSRLLERILARLRANLGQDAF